NPGFEKHFINVILDTHHILICQKGFNIPIQLHNSKHFAPSLAPFLPSVHIPQTALKAHNFNSPSRFQKALDNASKPIAKLTLCSVSTCKDQSARAIRIVEEGESHF